MALNRAALIIKVGDQPKPLELQYATMKNGMPISLIMERDWGKPLEEICPPNKVFAIVEVNPDLEAFYMDMLKPLNPDKQFDARAYRARKRILPLATFSEKINDSSLLTKLFSADKVPILDGKSLQASDFLDALLFTTAVNIVEDKNVIGSGTHNVGSGETYTTFAAGFADVGTITGDLSFIQTSNVTETSIALFAFVDNGYTISVSSDAESYGYPNVGYITTINHNNIGMDIQAHPNSTGTFDFSKFYLKSSGNYYYTGPLCRILGGPVIANIHDIMLDGNVVDGVSGHGQGLTITSTAVTCNVWNIQAWNLRTGVYTPDVHADNVMENCVVYDAIYHGFWFANNAFTARNLVAFNTGAYDLDYNQVANMTVFTKCGSQGTTGSEAGLRNLTAADQYESLDDTHKDFLRIKPGSTIDGAGTTSILAANTEDIRNNPRPNSNGLVSCGATEPAKGSIITLRGGFGSSLMGGFQ